jgi:hypothetical protein
MDPHGHLAINAVLKTNLAINMAGAYNQHQRHYGTFCNKGKVVARNQTGAEEHEKQVQPYGRPEDVNHYPHEKWMRTHSRIPLATRKCTHCCRSH